MNSENLNDFNQGLKYTELLDQQRNQSISKTFPEFYQLLKDEQCQI